MTKLWLTLFSPEFCHKTAGILLALFFIYSLWHCNNGGNACDTTIIGLYDKPLLISVIALELVVAVVSYYSLIIRGLTLHEKIVGCGLIIFELAIVARVGCQTEVTVAALLITANLIFGPTLFLLCLWLLRERFCEAIIIRSMISVFAGYSIWIVYSYLDISASSYYYRSAPRLSILYGNPNHLGNALAFAAIFCTAIAIKHKNTSRCVVLCCVILILENGLAATMSRGAVLSYLVGVFFTFGLLIKSISRKRLIVAGLFICASWYLVATVNPTGTSTRNRVATSFYLPDDSIGHRIKVWQDAVRMISDHYLVGVGVSEFQKQMEDKYKSPILVRQTYSTAMNNYLTLAAEAGIPVTILYISILIGVLFYTTRFLWHLTSISGVYAGLLGGVVSLLLFAMFTYTLGRVYANILLWLSLSLIAAKTERTSCDSKGFGSGLV